MERPHTALYKYDQWVHKTTRCFDKLYTVNRYAVFRDIPVPRLRME